MKIGVLFEGNINKPGGFYQSLNSALLLGDIKNERFEIEFITLDSTTADLLNEKKLNTKIYKINFFRKLFNFFFNLSIFKKLIINKNINHPFAHFILKNKFDLIIFLSPHALCQYCGPINFIINIWDLDHKKNSIFFEHRENYNFLKREELINFAIYHSTNIVVADKKTKEDLIQIYNTSEEIIVVQPFIPMLPKLYNINKLDTYKKVFTEFNLPNKKIVFYPATFWEHKNHKYILDASLNLKQKNNDEYFFVFCGNDKGNLDEIEKFILESELGSHVKILKSLTDDQLISIYLNSYVVCMPTTGGPTNLPIYEAFYFKKPIFYSANLLDKKDRLNDYITPINLDDPNDLIKKLETFSLENEKNKIEKAFEYYEELCSHENYKKNYLKLINNFFKKRIV
jgi:hypothetical protein